MKKLKPWLIVTILCYLFFLFWSIPADRVLSFISNKGYLPKELAMTNGPLGSWHNGQITGVRFNGIEIAELNWKLQPTALLLGRLQFAANIELPQGKSSCILQISNNYFAIKKLRGELAAAILGRILPGFEFSGSIQSEGMSYTFRDGFLTQADGQATWSKAGIGNPYNMDLGGLTIDMTTDVSGIRIRVNDTGGPLQAGLIGFLAPDGNYSFDGTISARQGSPPDLATFLQILGRRGSDGMIRVSTNGQLPLLNKF